MSLSRRSSRTVLAALWLALSCSPAPAEPPAQLDWDRSESALVLRYEELSEKLEGVGSLILELYGDGRVLVTRPEPYARAGSREARLSPGEIQRFLGLVALPELVAFDPARVQEEKFEQAAARRAEAEAAGRSPMLLYRSERERITLELHLLRYRARPAAESQELDLRIEWKGLRQDRDEFPEHPALGELASAVETARALLADLSGGE